MKFAEHLGSHLTPEWRTKYVQYDEMKVFLYTATESAPLSDDVNDEVLRRHFAKFDSSFFAFCDQELQKVNTFFAEKLAEAIRRYNELEIDVANSGVERLQSLVQSKTWSKGNVVEEDGTADDLRLQQIKPKKCKKKLHNLKVVVGEFYLSLILIQNFQQLNFTAFRKILKKHDKIFKTNTGVEYRISTVESAPFYLNKNINELIENTETIAIDDLEGGDRSQAMSRLRVPTLQQKAKAIPAFFWGFFSGMWLVMLACTIMVSHHFNKQIPYHCGNSLAYSTNSSYLNHPNTTSGPNTTLGYVGKDVGKVQQRWEPVIRMYRGFLIVILMSGLLGINIHGWREAGVNHVLIFELDPRHHLSSVEVLMVASFLGVLWNVSCLTFVMTDETVAMYAQPVAFAVFLLLFLLNPTKTFWFHARRWLIKIILRIFCAPFCAVRFADFWLADQMNSLVVALRDWEFLICFYAFELSELNNSECICSDPKVNFDFMRLVVTLLPAWFRFAQCLRRYYDTRKFFPHLVNAGKYFSSIMVTVLSTLALLYEESNDFTQPLHIVWLLCWFFSTLYALAWDLLMDWGLFAKNAGENYLLREQIVYDHKTYYYLAIIADILFRFLKPLTVTIGFPESWNREILTLVLGICEIIRRFIWNFFRLENEHLNNCGEFRAVRDISIKPIQSSHDEPEQQALIEEGRDKLSIEQMMDSETGPLPKRKVVQMLLTSNENTITKRASNHLEISTPRISKSPNFSQGSLSSHFRKSNRRLSSITVI